MKREKHVSSIVQTGQDMSDFPTSFFNTDYCDWPAIVHVFNPWEFESLFLRVYDDLAKIGECILLLLLSILLRHNQRFHAYWQLLFGLFVLTLIYRLDLMVNIKCAAPYLVK